MTDPILKDVLPMRPAHFMNLKVNVGKTLTPLPDLGELLNEKSFATVSLGWSKKGIEATILVKRPLVHVAYPQIEQGDSVELFLDTRDLKNSRHVTRFCHHFYFLPQTDTTDVEASPKGEITRFRFDDKHDLADPSLLRSTIKKERHSYKMHLFIAAEALVGYDPALFNRLGFTYRIHQFGGKPQHFSVSSEEYAIEKHPSLWASLTLT